jgi:hypothetical protein
MPPATHIVSPAETFSQLIPFSPFHAAVQLVPEPVPPFGRTYQFAACACAIKELPNIVIRIIAKNSTNLLRNVFIFVANLRFFTHIHLKYHAKTIKI